ncbi:MAG: aminoglycoside phosphotransferase [Deltaproteobacteria bacterium RBG_13_65_10]|nr:MAG: aminoglycoside phosphotransferase [Deltaproteobacteria bacterium RBG_13_65_10]
MSEFEIKDTAPIRSGEEMDVARLERYLRGRLPGPEGPLEVTQFPGGHSNLTYCLRMGGREYVLRRSPVGPVAPTAHDMTREYRVLKGLQGHFPPAPEPYALCEDSSVIGVPFYVMERRRGIVIRREIPEEVKAMGDPKVVHRTISAAMVDTLVALHGVDYVKAGLGDLGKPVGFVQRQVKGWAGRWQRAKTREVPEIDRLAKFLAERIPPSPPPVLVHNDYKLDNVMLHPSDPSRIIAVLDWEMSTVGDPLIDVGLLLAYWPRPDDPIARQLTISSAPTQPGFFSRQELLDRYAEKTGRDVRPIGFYETFALYKLTVVLEQIYCRYVRGQTNDERFAMLETAVPTLARAAVEVAEHSGL